MKEHLLQIFAQDGALSRHLPEFEERPQQIAMAEEIASAYLENRIALIEAGTGIGKSLAYLVPAILWAVREREKTLISTHTIALQEQLLEKDLPFLLKILGLDINATLVKGMGNYLCLLKYDQLAEKPYKLEGWVETTDDGSKSDVPFPLPPGMWESVAAETEKCTGNRCPHFRRCFFFKARKKLEESHLLIVNHHLLLSDIASEGDKAILPAIERLVLDEAHHLEEIALSIFTKQADKNTLLKLFDNPQITNRDLLVPKLVHAFSLLSPMRVQAPFPQKTQDAFAELSRLMFSLLETLEDKELLIPLQKQTDVLSTFFTETSQKARVRWIEQVGINLVLKEVDLDVSSLLRDRLFSRFFSSTLCSATLTAGRDFGFIRHRLGIEDASEKIFDSPFDFQNRVLLAVPTDMPDPSDPAFNGMAAEMIGKMLEVSKGSAFVLFTSYEMLDDCYNQLKNRFEILRQGDGPRTALIERFREKTGSILFGTDSFWEGVDVAGEALHCVILVKLPFKVPDDPLVEARSELLEKEGKSPFMDYLLPHAALKFKQGFGRLMRRKTDYGCVVCLDKRLVTKRYGKIILSGLPLCKKSFADRDKVLQEMKGLYDGV